MNESKKTANLLTYLRTHLPPQAVVLKHADRFTVGCLDASVSVNGRTVWIESKNHQGRVTTWEQVLKKSNKNWQVQLLTAVSLDHQAYAAIYVIWVDGGCCIIRAKKLMEVLKGCSMPTQFTEKTLAEAFKWFDSYDWVFIDNNGFQLVLQIAKEL